MCNHDESGTKKVDVVIIGAGAAGLQCGARLHDDTELSFVILEARDRVGGRIYSTLEERTTVDVAKAPIKFYRDHGASWIHGLGEVGNQNPIIELLQANSRGSDDIIQVFQGNAWMRPMSILHKEGAIAIFMDKERLRNDSAIINEALQRHFEIQKKISEYAARLFANGEGMETARISADEARQTVLEAEKTKCGENRKINPQVERLCPFYTFLNENWNGISSSMLPLHALFDEDDIQLNDNAYSNQGDFPGPHCKLQKGLQSLLETLVPKLKRTILLGQEVQRITRLEDSVRVESSSGFSVIADCCVCTIPLGCLKASASSIFEPSLTAEKLESISAISAGNYKKVFLTFSTIFWPIDVPLLALIRDSDEPNKVGDYLLVNSLWAKDGVPCMEAVLCGELGVWARGKSTNELKQFVTKFLEDTMPIDNVEDICIDCHVTRWEEDPYTMGSYSSFKLGTLERHVDALGASEWEGRLVFAGEATESEHMGSVHAALISGRKAGNKVQQFFESRDSILEP